MVTDSDRPSSSAADRSPAPASRSSSEAALSGKVAVVTGATSGIGHAVATRLGALGAAVGVNGRSPERAEAAARELRAAGIEAFALAADVARPADVETAMQAVKRDRGRLDIVVNNAGVPFVGDSATLALADWEAVLATNLTGAFLVAQAAFPMLVESGGVIVNVSSIFGHLGNARRAAYVTAKHGLEGLTKALAVEWAPHGIRVVAVSPGYVETPLIEQAMSAGNFDRTGPVGRTPLGRLGDPAEVAEVVAFLASSGASYVTGASIAVDGGWLANGSWALR